ncbi:MAG: lipopolysaccharide biosynthesis protein [Bacteroidales bacterium]|nr:lipopolysaccharide biosynthesis protein [Bacteroidales bacterium]
MQKESSKILKNSVMLYLRFFIIMIVSLYTSRVILHTLGEVDYGIYVLVGGFVTTFSMFNATFNFAVQRFLSYEMGRGNMLEVQKVFSVAVNIYLIIAVFILILLETVGLWYLNTKMVIPEERIYATNVCFQILVVSFVVNLISLPYNAVIIANEKMGIFAFVSIYEVICKLIVVYLIQYISFDKLIMYVLFLLFITISVRVFYGVYCRRKFPECKKIKVDDKKLYKSVLSLSGWNFLGSGASILTMSGMGIVLNYFTNVLVNSAKGVCDQVDGAVRQLIVNFMVALRPQITKSFASGDFEYLYSLISRGTRFAFILVCILCVPLFCISDFILDLWLEEVPKYASEFIKVCMIVLLTFPFSTILDMLLMASGKIKESQIVLSIIQILNLPAACCILFFKLPPYYVYIPFVVLELISLIFRLKYSIKYTDLSLKKYLVDIVKPILISVVVAFPILGIVLPSVYESTLVTSIISVVIIESILILCFWIILVRKEERRTILNKIYLVTKNAKRIIRR